MELRNLVSFSKVAELGSFSKAADALGYTQSTITAQVKQLESELGVMLFDRYGKVVTSNGKAFCAEMNRLFPAYSTVMHRFLKNSELIGLVYDDLAAGIPVPVEWAAKCGDQWTLHYSLVIGADIPADRIMVANPYGYLEEITVAEFLDRTSFEAFEDMPLFLRLGFAFGVFEKNTVFSVRKNAS